MNKISEELLMLGSLYVANNYNKIIVNNGPICKISFELLPMFGYRHLYRNNLVNKLSEDRLMLGCTYLAYSYRLWCT